MKFIIVMLLLPTAIFPQDSCDDILTEEITTLRKNISALEKYVKQKISEVSEAKGSSVVYTRWGKKTCPNDAQLVYSGFTGGSFWDNPGSAAQYVCLPRDPQWGIYVDGREGDNAYMYGTEYETYKLKDGRKDLHNLDVPCAVCWKKGPSAVNMIPARKQCYKGWHSEYQGYLMAGYHKFKSATQYVCVDEKAESLYSGYGNEDGSLLYKVEGICGSLKCPPYVDGRELTCVVCTR